MVCPFEVTSVGRKQANLSVIALLWAALVVVVGIKYDWQLAVKSAIALGMFLLQVAVLFYGGIAIISGGRTRPWPLLIGAALAVSYCLVLAYIDARRELLTHMILSVAVAIGLLVIARRAVHR